MRSNITAGFLALLAGAILTAISPKAVHGQSEELTTEELVRRADVVVVGKVTEVRSEWSRDRSRIYSKVTVLVDEHIKGDASQQLVVIATLGGEIDGIGEVYSHTARFKADERVIVFAAADQQGELRVVGGDEGKMTLAKDEVTGLQMVSDREPLGVFTSRLKRVVQAQSHKE
jgi:hypothetical protein